MQREEMKIILLAKPRTKLNEGWRRRRQCIYSFKTHCAVK